MKIKPEPVFYIIAGYIILLITLGVLVYNCGDTKPTEKKKLPPIDLFDTTDQK